MCSIGFFHKIRNSKLLFHFSSFSLQKQGGVWTGISHLCLQRLICFDLNSVINIKNTISNTLCIFTDIILPFLALLCLLGFNYSKWCPSANSQGAIIKIYKKTKNIFKILTISRTCIFYTIIKYIIHEISVGLMFFNLQEENNVFTSSMTLCAEVWPLHLFNFLFI